MSPEITSEFVRCFRALTNELNDEDIDEFLGATTVLEMPAKNMLIKDKMPVDSIYMILSGTLEVLVDHGGVMRKLANIGPGDMLGEVSAFSGGFASAFVHTVTAVRVLRLKHQALEALVSKNSELSILILQHLVLIMGRRLGSSTKEFMTLVKTKAAAKQLPDVVSEAGHDKGDYWPVCHPADAAAELKVFLSSLPGIEKFSIEDLAILYKAMKVTLYPARHVFTLQGQEADSVYLVVSGAVLLKSVNPLTNSASEKIMNAGEWFALLALTNDLPEFTTVVAPKQVFVASLTRDEFNRLFDESRAVSRLFLYMLVNELARRVQGLHSMIREGSLTYRLSAA